MTIKATIFLGAIFILCTSCEKCLNCVNAKFVATERDMLYAGRDNIQFSDGTTTIDVPVENLISDAANEVCGSYPATPSCTSIGYASLYHNRTSEIPVGYVERIDTEKHGSNWQCSNFVIGNTFFLDLDNDFTLTPRNNNDYEINVINNYMFNQVNIGDVQEIIQSQPLGNASELIRAVYHPTYGVLELEYTNPSETWKQVP